MAHALGVTREALLLASGDHSAPDGFDQLIARRLEHEPIAYIVGSRDFWTINLRVEPGVLIPRPDSETLIEAALAHFEGRSVATILDLGTGSGALLLAALSEWPVAKGLGIDASDIAVTVARANVDRLGVGERAIIRVGNWAEGIDARYDLILCNPPYVERDADLPRDVRDHEPHSALFAGADGLDDYRRLAPQMAGLIADGGCAVVEIGYEQAQAVSAFFAREGLAVALRRDLGGRDRCLVLTRRH